MLDRNDDWKGEHLIRSVRRNTMARPNQRFPAKASSPRQPRAQIAGKTEALVARLRGLAAQGFSMSEAAREAGVSESRVRALRSEYDIAFRLLRGKTGRKGL